MRYEPLKGDLNADGYITTADAADVSGDSRVSSLNALIILQNCKACALQKITSNSRLRSNRVRKEFSIT
ncbi:MAG: hypothetical protein EF812_04075 [Methanosarcinales archaeon]|nr:MAG: hypothetical protein EF812_04075 [Methanosarcinales archaeon]